MPATSASSGYDACQSHTYGETSIHPQHPSGLVIASRSAIKVSKQHRSDELNGKPSKRNAYMTNISAFVGQLYARIPCAIATGAQKQLARLTAKAAAAPPSAARTNVSTTWKFPHHIISVDHCLAVHLPIHAGIHPPTRSSTSPPIPSAAQSSSQPSPTCSSGGAAPARPARPCCCWPCWQQQQALSVPACSC